MRKKKKLAERTVDLETILTDKHAFGLETATPLQRSICRALDGQSMGQYSNVPGVLNAFGGQLPTPGAMPDEMVLLAAIRCGKSLLAAAVAYRATQIVDVSPCGPGHSPRISVLSTSTNNARVVFDHLCGRVMRSEQLRATVIGDPRGESIWIKHPTGMPIEICVTAGARAGSSLVGRWMAGVIFDEAPRMVGEADGVVNLNSSMEAIAGRMLPGAQVLYIGSPWAPFGPVYDMVQEHWGKPSQQIIVVRAPGWEMNPVIYTPEHCEKLRKKNENAYRMNVLAEFGDPESAMFSSVELENAMRKEPMVIGAVQNQRYVAAMDAATRGNAWTLVVLTCDRYGGENGLNPHYQVVLNKQWIGSKANPLKADIVFAEQAKLLEPYGVDLIHGDQYAFDVLANVAERYGLKLDSTPSTVLGDFENAERMRIWISQGMLELPPDPVMRADLMLAKKRLTQTGVKLALPTTSDGRHADYVPSLSLACANAPDPPEVPMPEKTKWQRMLERESAEKTDRWEQVADRWVGRVA